MDVQWLYALSVLYTCTYYSIHCDGGAFIIVCGVRYRGIVEEERPVSYWHTWTARLAFIIFFEVITCDSAIVNPWHTCAAGVVNVNPQHTCAAGVVNVNPQHTCAAGVVNVNPQHTCAAGVVNVNPQHTCAAGVVNVNPQHTCAAGVVNVNLW